MSETIRISNLVDGGWRQLAFSAFRPGVEIFHIVEGSEERAGVALLRYAPGASVPWHWHQGLETILVLEGSQSDDRGRYRAGELVTNAAGTGHRVWSVEGCVVLIQWERPVRIVEDDPS
jgi:anti-sigma factor ChrR (cupin superfamily)